MRPPASQLDCLYYPFSRLLDPVALKYLLLVYDSVTFVDEAESPSWRYELLEDLRADSPVFDAIGELSEEYDRLGDLGIVRVVSPVELAAASDPSAALATLADLEDQRFVDMASRPSRYGLPSGSSDTYYPGLPEQATWQIFGGKIPEDLKSDAQLSAHPSWNAHVLRPGDDHLSWTLSYAAGSAVALNHYLLAAQELNATPITSSALHNSLLMHKMKRAFGSSTDGVDMLESVERQRFRATAGAGEVLHMFKSLFPAASLARLSVAEILKFREETAPARESFHHEISAALRVVAEDPATATYDRDVALVMRDIDQRFREAQKALVSTRDKLIPAAGEAVLYGAAGGGAFSSAATLLGGLSAAGVVAASALTIAGASAQKAGQIWLERRASRRDQSPAVAYLMSVDRAQR